MKACKRQPKATDWDLYYSRPFRTACWPRHAARHALLRLIRNSGVPLDGSAEILECGGGGSCFYEAVAETVRPACYCVADVHKPSLKELQERIARDRADLVQPELLFKDVRTPCGQELCRRFDLVFSMGLIEHFSRADLARVITFHLDCAKPGGIVILFFPTPTLLYRAVRRCAELLRCWIFHDERPLRIQEVQSLVRERGTVLERCILYRMILTQAYLAIRKK